MGGTGRAAWGTGIKKSKNKGLIVCWNKGNKRVWLEMNDCLSEAVGKGVLGLLGKGLSDSTKSILNLQYRYSILCDGH